MFLFDMVSSSWFLSFIYGSGLLWMIASIRVLRVDVGYLFTVSLLILIVTGVTPWVALSANHFWWFTLLGIAGHIVVFIFTMVVLDSRATNSEGAIAFIFPIMLFLFSFVTSMVALPFID